MTAFVEECRKEWARLGVPDLLADEMAADLEADLVEAQADGVSTTEMLGESDPRRFAATWASERGLVSEPEPQKKRRRIWPWIVALVLLVLFLAWTFLQSWGSGQASSTPPVRVQPVAPIQSVRVPDLVGVTACRAERIAVDAGVPVHPVPRSRCHALVIGQTPAAGRVTGRHVTVTLRLRG